MASDLTVAVSGVTKVFKVPLEHRTRLRDHVANFFRSPGYRRLEALKDVDLEIRSGEFFGIIGRNGSGKSTLLKILAGIYQPTQGKVKISGRLSPFIELGVGFNPELSARDNIFLNGAILGMKKAEIQRKFDEIVAFAQVEKFIDTPVKHYSSGMYVRLAFAVAAHLETEILLVDEVLAVGDLEFQRRCLGKMRELSGQGRTCLFVSHSMGAIGRLCEETLLLDRGALALKGPTFDAIAQYQKCADLKPEWIRQDLEISGEVAFLRISILGSEGPRASFTGSESILVELDYVVREPVSACSIGFRVCNAEGMVVLTTGESDELDVPASAKRPGRYVSSAVIPGRFLSPGSYTLLVAAHMPHRQVYDTIDQQVGFEVSSVGSLTSLDGRLGVVAPLFHWQTDSFTQPAQGLNAVVGAEFPTPQEVGKQ